MYNANRYFFLALKKYKYIPTYSPGGDFIISGKQLFRPQFCAMHSIRGSKICVPISIYTLDTLLDFSNLFQLKGLKPKNKGHTNFYECCDLTEKVYLNCM